LCGVAPGHNLVDRARPRFIPPGFRKKSCRSPPRDHCSRQGAAFRRWGTGRRGRGSADGGGSGGRGSTGGSGGSGPARPARFAAKGCRCSSGAHGVRYIRACGTCSSVTAASASSLLPCSYGFRIVKSARPRGALTSEWRCEIYICAPGGSAPVVSGHSTNRSHRHNWPAVRALRACRQSPCRRRGMSLN
jgi:hypothetical protein